MSSATPSVSSTDASHFPAPPGTKVTTNLCIDGSGGGPDDCNPNGPSESNYPILLYDGYIYWPLSYYDNRVSFALVITSGSSNRVLDTIEAPGSRYIDSIEVHTTNKTVDFVGQASGIASVKWSNLSIGTASPSSSSITLSSSATAATTNSTASPSSEGASFSGGTIAGIVLGALAIVIAAVVAVLAIKKKKAKRRELREEEQGTGAPQHTSALRGGDGRFLGNSYAPVLTREDGQDPAPYSGAPSERTAVSPPPETFAEEMNDRVPDLPTVDPPKILERKESVKSVATDTSIYTGIGGALAMPT